MDNNDITFIRRSIEIAQQAKANGNHPFGALLVNEHGHILLEVENSVVTHQDCTGHAETNLIRLASKQYHLKNARFIPVPILMLCVAVPSFGAKPD